ncbi:hypothetical protein PCANB_002730 [Pneumocystis canis]|nr:hypothetical protein PCK1_002817 [Pneumocystis canis]KAG5438624.1 hypothetical protein PCANB_002730 [Pneumocystis canis]
MKEFTGSFSISFQSAKNSEKWKKELSYTRKTVLKNDLDEDIEEETKDELLSGFDESGALFLNPKNQTKKGPLVISALKNKDWKQTIKQREELSFSLNKEPPKTENASHGKTKDNTQAYGLTFINSEKKIPFEQTEKSSLSPKPIDNTETNEDELAIKALLADVEGKKTDLNLILPMITSNTNKRINSRYLIEDEIYRIDVVSLPDPSTLEDYENVPVEEFGNALLRGMGWKEGEGIGKNKQKITVPAEIVQRAPFLGIGAKEYATQELDELGAWGKGVAKKKVDKTYTPVLKINKRTGEIVNEGETGSDSKNTHKKDNMAKELPERFKNESSKKYNHDYSSDEYKNKSQHSDYEKNHYYYNHSNIKKDSDKYKRHHSTNRRRNDDYNDRKDRN